MGKLIDILFNGFSIAGIILGLYLLMSGLQLKYVKTHFLKAWLVVVILQISFYLININHILPSHLVLNYFAFPLSMLHMPLFYLAIVDLTRIRTIKPLEIGLHCLPYTLYVSYLVGINVLTTDPLLVVDGFLQMPGGLPFFVYAYIGIPLAISGFVYSVLCLVVMLKYKRELNANLSNTDSYQLHWVTYLVWTIILLFILVYLVITLRTDFLLTKASLTFKLVNIFLFFFLFAFGVKYQKQLIYFIRNKVVPLTIVTKKKYTHSALTTKDMHLISEKLHAIMVSNTLYLDEYLTLQQVAETLQESPQNISQTLNEYLKINFYNYVNRFRLELAEKKLLDPQYSNLSIIGIAMDCGFKSKSTFYKLFKQKTGKTPSDYRNSR